MTPRWLVRGCQRLTSRFLLFMLTVVSLPGALLLPLVSLRQPARAQSSPDALTGPPQSAPPALSPPLSEPLASPKLPPIRAASAILVDAVSGQVLYERQADVPRPMASTTKIMTALLFCQHVAPDEIITASKTAAGTGESSLHLKLGERIVAEDLLKAILMRSANDACVAAAEHVAGSEAAFAEMMNRKAAELGAKQTHFVNSHGLHHKDHYTTARDLALIARAAMREPRIAEVVRTLRARIERSSGSKDLTMRNHSRFLSKFPGADGIKTGYTRPAGPCYVGSATVGGWRLISVVLKSPDYVGETAALMKFGFDHFEPHILARAGDACAPCPVAESQKPEIATRVQSPVQVVAPKGKLPVIERRIQFASVKAPVAPGAPVGTLEAWVDNRCISSSPLLAGEAAPPKPVPVAARGNSWPFFALLSSLLATGLVSLRYGTRYRKRVSAFTKSARRRWRRLQTLLRTADR